MSEIRNQPTKGVRLEEPKHDDVYERNNTKTVEYRTVGDTRAESQGHNTSPPPSLAVPAGSYDAIVWRNVMEREEKQVFPPSLPQYVM